ncbi:phosphotransferase family protein [Gordonia desulfuricans]|uniref:Phosphotransferase family protein n=1 Tax=Gordonia desulfuricans TaxID=89051 RepID=A0A7K3LKL2_9ACTN|nr:phosphotransferase family protein [Gordonia desulfuricans]NDK88809.1 phosphotransferase family protein [Gordonia desulfuricans]
MTEHDATTEPAGIDRASVTAWFTGTVADVTPPLHFDLITGGRSNLTYRVVDEAGHRWVLRRPPTGHILASAHDVVREWHILDILADTPVPVPPTVGCCTDPAVTGADFYVMDHVDGVVLDDASTVAALPRPNRTTAASNMVETLAAIHAVDTETGALTEFRRPGGYIERQLRRWGRQLTAGGVGPGPIWEIHELLGRRIPAQRWTGVVHGDFRPGNLLITPDGEVAAVLDWELWTVGDVLADLGWLVASWSSADVFGWAPDPDDGFPDTATVVDEYARLTGRDVGDLDFYHAFAIWRLAAIAEGVAARFRAGAMGQQDLDIDEFERRSALLAGMARELLRRA